MLSELDLGISRALLQYVFEIGSNNENFHLDLQTESVRKSGNRRSGASKGDRRWKNGKREQSEFRLVTNEQHRGDQSRVRLFERSTTDVSIVERRRVSGENSRSNERSDGQSESMRRTGVETFFFFSAESVADLSDRR